MTGDEYTLTVAGWHADVRAGNYLGNAYWALKSAGVDMPSWQPATGSAACGCAACAEWTDARDYLS